MDDLEDYTTYHTFRAAEFTVKREPDGSWCWRREARVLDGFLGGFPSEKAAIADAKESIEFLIY
jgi:hypothetical protein